MKSANTDITDDLSAKRDALTQTLTPNSQGHTLPFPHPPYLALSLPFLATLRKKKSRCHRRNVFGLSFELNSLLWELIKKNSSWTFFSRQTSKLKAKEKKEGGKKNKIINRGQEDKSKRKMWRSARIKRERLESRKGQGRGEQMKEEAAEGRGWTNERDFKGPINVVAIEIQNELVQICKQTRFAL